VTSATVVAQDSFTLLFENSGPEAGITAPGATDFSIFGSNWTGGIVLTEGIPPLYASGRFSYEVNSGPAEVTFDTPIDRLDFFYVHGSGHAQGTATVFNAAGDAIGSGTSIRRTFFNDPNNFLSFDPLDPIVRITFSSAVIDDFSFTTVPEPGSLALLGLLAAVALRRR